MIRSTTALIMALCLMLFAIGDASAAAGDAIASAAQRSARAESEFRSCRRGAEKEVVDCIARATIAFAGSLSACSYIASAAPLAAPTARTAAKSIEGAKTKDVAVSVLNRASSVLRGLAAKSSGETREVYGRIDRAFRTAVGVLSSKS